MNKKHEYNLRTTWTGNTGQGTKDYRAFERSHIVSIADKEDLHCSSDPSFRGDPSKHNPEELFLASLSTCHMLWYLHLCSQAGVVVVHYTDDAIGVMEETAEGGGRFSSVSLHPNVTVSEESMIEKANELHEAANKNCFIANSCNFQVLHHPVTIQESKTHFKI